MKLLNQLGKKASKPDTLLIMKYLILLAKKFLSQTSGIKLEKGLQFSSNVDT